MNDFLTHACEQVLRFTQVKQWDDLPEPIKVQLGFNMGAVALGLKLTKEEGYGALVNVREGKITMADFRSHLKSLIELHQVKVDEAKIARPY